MSPLWESSIGLLAAALLQATAASLLHPAPGQTVSAGTFTPAWLGRPVEGMHPASASPATGASTPLRAEQAVPPFAMFLVDAFAVQAAGDLPSPRPSR